jgi:hypothetical protein
MRTLPPHGGRVFVCLYLGKGAEGLAMARAFHTLDVFTGQKLAGNPLAVVHDSAGLDTAAMQAIAREFNLSETVFVPAR